MPPSSRLNCQPSLASAGDAGSLPYKLGECKVLHLARHLLFQPSWTFTGETRSSPLNESLANENTLTYYASQWLAFQPSSTFAGETRSLPLNETLANENTLAYYASQSLAFQPYSTLSVEVRSPPSDKRLANENTLAYNVSQCKVRIGAHPCKKILPIKML